jgi:hypothetical protein
VAAVGRDDGRCVGEPGRVEWAHRWDRERGSERGRHRWRIGATGFRSGGTPAVRGARQRRGEGDPTGDLFYEGRFLPASGGDVAEGGMPSGEKERGTVMVAGLGLQEDGRFRPGDGVWPEIRVMKDPVDEV